MTELQRHGLLTCIQTVEADGMVCEAEPASVLPLAQTFYVY